MTLLWKWGRSRSSDLLAIPCEGAGDCLLRHVISPTLVHFVDFLEAVLIDLFPFPIVCKPTCKSDQEKNRLNRNYCCHLLSWKLKLTVHICILLVLHTTYAYNKILSLLIRWVTGVYTSSVFKFSIWCLQITAFESVVISLSSTLSALLFSSNPYRASNHCTKNS